MKRQIKAEIIAGSLNEHGQKITTWVLTYPRIIHAEMMTHRVFSRNAASSRAIPALKMIADVEADPFIPVAWQLPHKGMQGTEYYDDEQDIADLNDTWLSASKKALEAVEDFQGDATKQLTNRLLEPFQWYTAIFTTTETENFFNLRCPQYESPDGELFKSRKDYAREGRWNGCEEFSIIDWLSINKGQGEIHISLLAEAMWDSMNEYDYKQLKAGEYHIPFGDKFDDHRVHQACMAGDYEYDIDEAKIMIATARCARVSYNNFEGKDDYEADIKLYDILKSSGHFSPFEHCARAMTKDEYVHNIRGDLRNELYARDEETEEATIDLAIDKKGDYQGWSGNFRGFVQLRQEL